MAQLSGLNAHSRNSFVFQEKPVLPPLTIGSDLESALNLGAEI